MKYTIYAIQYEDQIIYIGQTTHGKHRWTCHKTKARKKNEHSRPIHDFMRTRTSDTKTFPEFSWIPIAETFDSETAYELETYFQSKHHLGSYQKSIRPDMKSYETRCQSI